MSALERTTVLAMAVVVALLPAGAWAAPPTPSDVNGDGYAELIAGDSFGWINSKGAVGTFSVLYGSADGITDHDQRWHRDRRGIKGPAVGSPNDERFCCLGRFAAEIGTGDFDGDGYADVVATHAANPAADGYAAHHTSVSVLYGSADDLTSRDQLWTLASPGIKGRAAHSWDLRRVAGADFDGDGFDDLIFESRNGGYRQPDVPDTIHVLAGSADGLTSRDQRLSTDAVAAVSSDLVVGTTSIAIGDFNRDGRADAAMPANRDAKGAVAVFYGTRDLLSADRAEEWTFASPGVPGARRAGDTFGTALAAGDFDGDGDDDLAVGAQMYENAAGDEGRVVVLQGSEAGLQADGVQLLTGADEGLDVVDDVGFGYALAAGDTDGDGIDDLAVGIRGGECVGCYRTDQVPRFAQVLRGSAHGLVTTDALTLSSTDHFEITYGYGRKLLFRDYNGDGNDDLLIGTEDELGVLYGSGAGLDPATFERWHSDLPKVKGSDAFLSIEFHLE